MNGDLPKDFEFALCLTHDVDRPYKTFQAPYYALKERDPSHLKPLVTSERPYWQFEEIMALEDELGVRSSFYFLNEKRLLRDKDPRDWIDPKNWKLFAGRYDITSDEIVDVIRMLDDGGWEVGLHGSYESYDDLERLKFEKETLEEILGHQIVGGRQHYLNLKKPESWKYQKKIGLKYDASLGSSEKIGFEYGYGTLRPFNDDFVVFPLTVMEIATMDSSDDLKHAWNRCQDLLYVAKDNNSVMTILWHPRMFNQDEFPGYKDLYRRIIKEALQLGAWVGPCEKWYDMNEPIS
ncbi:polysaccharide deacetylase family protein [Natrarchaeobius oligotrophus]|uniref:NodB homology domain-containing protein n=1 Tax=Natrarchaeobius chitinivorans TaxID=1679083 RepID=A0A3N6PAP2_NATCH|nr:polysaccharide deacetylase family protein [Natrarchaeobius chitinivorans]RQG96179.1 hypothetical protein EA472_20855 [Natrarchaeobius chitinivorans]